MKLEFHTGCYLTKEPYILPTDSYEDKYWVECGSILDLAWLLIEEHYYEIQLLNYLSPYEFRRHWYAEKSHVALIDC